MMRVTEVHGDGAVAQLLVEGWVTRETAQELNACSETALAAHRPLLVDVSGVKFVDPAGVDVLRSIVPKGAVLVGCSGFLTELLQREAAAEPAPAEQRSGEATFIERLRRGDDDAFEQLVRQHGGRLLAVARRLLPNEHDAQDAVQEAFLSAFKAIDTFGGTAKLSTWLHRIVVNAALMKLRSRRRKPEESIDELLPRFDDQGEWAGDGAHWEMASDLLERRETRALVRTCIDRLPETYRTVLLLRDIEGLDTDETATALRITPNAVKIRLHRGRQALRTLLQPELTVRGE